MYLMKYTQNLWEEHAIIKSTLRDDIRLQHENRHLELPSDLKKISRTLLYH